MIVINIALIILGILYAIMLSIFTSILLVVAGALNVLN